MNLRKFYGTGGAKTDNNKIECFASSRNSKKYQPKAIANHQKQTIHYGVKSTFSRHICGKLEA